MMSYNLRDRIPRNYAAMNAGQDDEEVFHDSFQYQQPPAPALPASSQEQTSSTPFSGPPISSGPPQDDIAALTAAIASVRAENDVLEREMEVARLQAELHALQRQNAQLQSKSNNVQPSRNQHSHNPH